MESQTAAQMAGSRRMARQYALLRGYSAAAKVLVDRLEEGIGYGYEHAVARSNALFEVACLIEGCVQQWGIGQAEVDGTLPESLREMDFVLPNFRPTDGRPR